MRLKRDPEAILGRALVYYRLGQTEATLLDLSLLDEQPCFCAHGVRPWLEGMMLLDEGAIEAARLLLEQAERELPLGALLDETRATLMSGLLGGDAP